ncbi:MAG: hypothetical protein Kow006_33850 [Gammaproteobacteria bacterium]
MRVLASFEGFAEGAHEGIRELVEQWATKHLAPLLPRGSLDTLVARVKRHSKGEARFSVSLRLHLPRRQTLVARGIDADVRQALTEAENRLLRKVEAHLARLRHQAAYRRKARRARLAELKARLAEQGSEIGKEARRGIEPLLPRLERIVRRELAYLRYSGELPNDYPTVQDVVDEAVAAVSAHWRPGESSDKLLERLVQEAFRALDRETRAASRYGEPLSLEEAPLRDAESDAEAMVEEEIHEFYQPDEALQLSDILPDEETPSPEAELETAQRDYALQALGHLPTTWRRALLLSDLDRFSGEEVADILDAELREVENWIRQAQAFLLDHLRQAGFDEAEPPLLSGWTERL